MDIGSIAIAVTCGLVCSFIGFLGGCRLRKFEVTKAENARDGAEATSRAWREFGQNAGARANTCEDALREIEERAHAARCKAARGDQVSTSGQ